MRHALHKRVQQPEYEIDEDDGLARMACWSHLVEVAEPKPKKPNAGGGGGGGESRDPVQKALTDPQNQKVNKSRETIVKESATLVEHMKGFECGSADCLPPINQSEGHYRTEAS